jgi:hypothetical protein
VSLDPRLAADLRRRHDELLDAKPFHRPDNLRRCYDSFRRAFGPEVLESLSGEPLLLKLHERNTKDSLVYSCQPRFQRGDTSFGFGRETA